MALPSTHKALVVVESGKVAIREQTLPKYGDEEILVKIRTVALNPTDWKHPDHLLKPGQSIGCDFSGDVVAVGSDAASKGFSVGDAVAGFTRGGFAVGDNGAFQEFVTTYPENVWHKPASLPYEDAAPMGGIAFSTAVCALHTMLNVPYETSEAEPILIWSGATGVGMYAIKLATLAGLKVITTASKKNWNLVKSLGAEAVFDYKDPEVVEKIGDWVKKADYGPLKNALDAASKPESIAHCVDLVGKGGKVITLPPKDMDLKGAEAKFMLIYRALKQNGVEERQRMSEWTEEAVLAAKKQNPTYVENNAKLQEWNQKMPSYIESGKLTKGLVPLKVYRGMDQLPEAIDYVRQGKVSAEKLVVSF